MALGRTTEGRTQVVGITSSSAALTGAAGSFSSEDVGRSIAGTGVPAGATISAVASDTAATLSANATATNASLSALLGPAVAAVGYLGWSPETAAESATYSVAAKNAGTLSPSQQTNAYTRIAQRGRG